MPETQELTQNAALVGELLDKLRAYYARPHVQIQLLAILLALVAALFLARWLWRILDRPLARWIDHLQGQRTTRQTLRTVVRYVRAISFPVLALITFQVTALILASMGWRTGLMGRFTWVLWTIMGFQLFITTLYELFDDDEIHRYHYRLFLPLLIVIILLEILSNITDLRLLADTVLAVIFDNPVTLGAVFIATVGLYFWTDAVQGIHDLLYKLITTRTTVDQGSVKASLTLMRYVLVLIGVLFVLSQLNLNSTTVAAITGGLSVGIGFGLSEILRNFISGILLLFERSLHPGDVIEVNDQISIVENVSMRATTVRTLNNEELVIPNQTFFTSSFKTYTGTDKQVRVPIFVKTDCVINPPDVINLLIDTSLAHPDVLADPTPSVFILEYGDNVASFQLNVWLDNPTQSPRVRSEIKLQIWDAFAANGVALPFPESEIHFSNRAPLEINGLVHAPAQS